MRKTVQFIGGAISTVKVPSPKAGIERWSLNDCAFKTKFADRYAGWTRWFDLHHNPHILTRKHNTLEWFKSQTNPIYRWTVDPLVPTSVAYPLKDIQRFFNVNGAPERHFLSTFDYMMALAIWEEFEVIDIYGFRMLAPRYMFQLPSAFYWVGRARGSGTTVTVHGESALNPVNKMYGLEATTNLI